MKGFSSISDYEREYPNGIEVGLDISNLTTGKRKTYL